jgi:hypothetical protein
VSDATTPATTPTAPQHAAPSNRGRVIAITTGVAVGLVALFFVIKLFTGHLETGPRGLPAVSDVTPDFKFDVASVKPIATAKGKINQSEAYAAAHVIREELGVMYQLAYLDPENWKKGDYDKMLPLFDDGVRDAAIARVDGLTLGDAGKTFDEVKPVDGSLKMRILVDANGKPATAVAVADFKAKGTTPKGGVTLITSKGQFFLHPEDAGKWSIFAFSAGRSEDKVTTGGNGGGG